jgi:hypothetical protein
MILNMDLGFVSGSKSADISSGIFGRFKTSSVWTETQGSPMDRSVAKLLLHKPLYRKTTDRHANRVA